jgi:hypothetical protein
VLAEEPEHAPPRFLDQSAEPQSGDLVSALATVARVQRETGDLDQLVLERLEDDLVPAEIAVDRILSPFSFC